MNHYIVVTEKNRINIESELLGINNDKRGSNIVFLDPHHGLLRNFTIKLYQIRLYYTQCINDNIFILLDQENKEISYIIAQIFMLMNIHVVYLNEKKNYTINKIRQLLSNDIKTNRLFHRSYSTECDSNYYSVFKHIFSISSGLKKESDMESVIKKTLLSITLQDLIVFDDFFPKLRLLNKRSLDSIVNDWAFNCNTYNKLQLLQLGIYILSKNAQNTQQYATALVLVSEAHYHQDNKFHNFYHAIDVLQATHYLFSTWDNLVTDKNIKMTLLISALLHDSAHTGSNNNLLLQNKNLIKEFGSEDSILETLHFKILTHIIKCMVNTTNYKKDELNLLENFNFDVSEELILATDMKKHDAFLQKLKNYDLSNKESLFKYKMIIKAADISNVTRPLEASAQWGVRISQEFMTYNLLTTEKKNDQLICDDVDKFGNKTYDKRTLGELTVKDCINLEPGVCKSQIFFIEVFAKEFFTLLRDKFINENASLKQLVVNLDDNYSFWEKRASE
ncbi:hypothetical protein QEN19_003177 [Hanseniaspora menglaensis]